MKLSVAVLALGLMGAAQMGLALTAQEAVADLQAEGYTRIEVKVGATQMKVEAIRGTEKLELVLDRASGAVLKRETEAVRPGENTAAGVRIRERDRDFVRARAGGGTGLGDDHGGRQGRGSDDAPGDDNGGQRGHDRSDDSADDDRGDDDRLDGRDDDRGDDDRHDDDRGDDDRRDDDKGRGRGSDD